MSLEAQLAFIGIVLGAYVVGTALGFGTSIFTITFASLLMPLDQLLPIVATLNFGLGLYLAIRYRRDTAWRALLLRFAPPVALGVPVGYLLFSLREAAIIRLAFGIFVLLLAARELTAKKGEAPAVPVTPWRARLLLLAGGVIHGLYTTGGPLIVYVFGRELHDKAAFRATTATVFLPMTLGLIISYYFSGLFQPPVLRLGLLAVPVVLLGMWLGEKVYQRVEADRFKRGVWALLCVGALVLIGRAAFNMLS